MADYIRELVSGNKSRFKDASSNTNLDLAYITDQLVIMGFPASGIEGLYRNKRQDAQRFLRERHGRNFWVFNFCPVKENGYEKEVFEGRVSRWPFPDHHAPPLAVLPLVAREMTQWLQGSPDRVAVLHCKAGKGRSGTLACAYLLTLPEATPPQLPKSFTSKQLAERHTEQTIQQIERVQSTSDDTRRAQTPLSAEEEKVSVSSPDPESEPDAGAAPGPGARKTMQLSAASTVKSLESVLDLHSSRRMKPAKDSKDGAKAKARRGVSIPSQRRWLYYWSLILSGDAPRGFGGFWDSPASISSNPIPSKPNSTSNPNTDTTTTSPSPSNPSPNRTFPTPPPPQPQKIRITHLTLRMRKPSGLKAGLVQAANTLIEKTSSKDSASLLSNASPGGSGKLWASLARYDDELVGELGRRYREEYAGESVGEGGGGTGGGEHMFADDRWDREKMVRSFRRFKAEEVKGTNERDKKINNYIFHPISDPAFKASIASTFPPSSSTNPSSSTTTSTPSRATTPAPASASALKPQLSADQKSSLAAALNTDEDIEEDDLGSTPTLGDLSAAKAVVQAKLGGIDTPGPGIGVSDGPAGIDSEREGGKEGVVVDASREVRIKLYMGQVFLAWAWIVPVFHMPLPSSQSSTSKDPSTSTPITSPSSSSSPSGSTTPQKNINGGTASPLSHPSSSTPHGDKPKGTHLVLSMENGAKELDFAIGIGAEILEMGIGMEWVYEPAQSQSASGPQGGITGGVTGPGPRSGAVDGRSGTAAAAETTEEAAQHERDSLRKQEEEEEEADRAEKAQNAKNRAASADSAAGKTGVAKTIQAVAEGGLTGAAVGAKQATED